MKPSCVALALSLAVGTIAACSQKLAAPADCPALCPGGQAVALDTVLTAIIGQDSTYFGFTPADSVAALPIANGTPVLDSRAVIRFAARLDTVTVNAVQYRYTIDSARITLGLQSRDTLALGLNFAVYRLPARVDTSITFNTVNSYITPSNLVARIPIPDSLRSGTVTYGFYADTLNRIAIPAADSGIISFAVVVESATPTGVRLSGYSATTNLTQFNTYASLTGLTGTAAFQNYVRYLSFGTYVFAPRAPAPAGTIVLGDAPSSRAIIRFPWPAKLRDSATIIRATLELVPQQPILGIRNEPTAFITEAILADLGGKSPLNANYALIDTIANGTTDTVRAEIAPIVRLWQSTSTSVTSGVTTVVSAPTAVFLRSSPEAGSFGRPVFLSTTTGGAPRLRITYLKPFKFESP